MAIYRLYRNKPFEPEAIAMMTHAYAEICRTLGVSERNRRGTDIVAKAVIEFAQRGVRDPIRLRERVLQVLRDEQLGVPVTARRRGTPDCRPNSDPAR